MYRRNNRLHTRPSLHPTFPEVAEEGRADVLSSDIPLNSHVIAEACYLIFCGARPLYQITSIFRPRQVLRLPRPTTQFSATFVPNNFCNRRASRDIFEVHTATVIRAWDQTDGAS